MKTFWRKFGVWTMIATLFVNALLLILAQPALALPNSIQQLQDAPVQSFQALKNTPTKETLQAVEAQKDTQVLNSFKDMLDQSAKTPKDVCQDRALETQQKLQSQFDKLDDNNAAKKQELSDLIQYIKRLRAESSTAEARKSDGKKDDRTWTTNSTGTVVCRFGSDESDPLKVINTSDALELNAPAGGGVLSDQYTSDGQDKDNAKATSGEGNPCSEAGQALAWIICPVVKLIGDTTGQIYDYIEKHFLQIAPSYLDGTEVAWRNFRDWANIIFAVIFIIIIISQVTGLGVSNYGVKKILPTLIMVAILVNLSFFLCKLAVDVSNLVGYGVRNVFLSLPTGLKDAGNPSPGAIIIGLAQSVLGVGGVTALGVKLIFSATSFSWLPMLILTLVTVFVSVVFFFALLGLRQGAIVILVALAPVAIICYALPNTKKLFERWWKIFLAMLILYPLCGALMGGGEFAARIMMAAAKASGESATFAFAMVAVLMQAVPFFFIPSLLRSSFSAMGNLGNKISAFGGRLGRASSGAIAKSERFKDLQEGLKADHVARQLRRSESERGLSGLMNRVGKRIRSGDGTFSTSLRNAHQRRQSRLIKDTAGWKKTNQDAAFVVDNGMSAAERRLNDDMMKNFETNYKSDIEFMNDYDRQESAYDEAIEKINENPHDQSNIARLRALQNILGSSPDGQDTIQKVLNRRLYNAQQTAIANGGGNPVLSVGMQTASQTLMNDHGGFKKNDRGLAATLKDMNKNTVFKNGTFTAEELYNKDGSPMMDADGNPVFAYRNAYYGAEAAKGSADELANANDATLENLLSSIGSMNDKQLDDVYRNASEAITNDTIRVKPENVDRLNKIRQAAYAQMQAAASSSTDYHDDSGRTFVNTSGDNYEYTDAGGAVHNFTRDATTGNFTEVGGAGEVISGDNMRTASENFNSNYGSNYRHLTTSDEFKVAHAPTNRKVKMPEGWMRNSAGTWINSRDGFRNLKPDEIRRAEAYEAHNIQVDIDNDTHK